MIKARYRKHRRRINVNTPGGNIIIFDKDHLPHHACFSNLDQTILDHEAHLEWGKLCLCMMCHAHQVRPEDEEINPENAVEKWDEVKTAKVFGMCFFCNEFFVKNGRDAVKDGTWDCKLIDATDETHMFSESWEELKELGIPIAAETENGLMELENATVYCRVTAPGDSLSEHDARPTHIPTFMPKEKEDKA